ncbi:ATP-sensitive inward rectifier potassium channel 10 [bacterium]|nr:ATP-sensitive inward rectifier potassium channel 10 [bacterium]
MEYIVHKKNAPKSPLKDLYHTLLKRPWREVISLFALAYLLINLAFGLLFWLGDDALSPGPASFWDCFYFSVQTFSTVGYGTLSPSGTYANVISTIEIFTGLLSIALITGLVFAKFSIPTAKILFTDNLLLTQMDGKRVLLFRLANARSNQVLGAQLNLNMFFDVKTAEGSPFRRIETLTLRRATAPVFSLSMTGIHYIDESSPLAEHVDKLKENKENFEFLISITGLDDIYGQTIHAMKMYSATEIQWDKQFADILHIESTGNRYVDFANFNKFK